MICVLGDGSIYRMVTGHSGSPPWDTMAKDEGRLAAVVGNHTRMPLFCDSSLIPLTDPPADAWWSRWILWCSYHTHLLNTGGSSSDIIRVASEEMHRWLRSTRARTRYDFYIRPRLSIIVQHMGFGWRRRLLNRMWRHAPPGIRQCCGSGPTIWASRPGVPGPCTMRRPDGFDGVVLWEGARYREWLQETCTTQQPPDNSEIMTVTTESLDLVVIPGRMVYTTVTQILKLLMQTFSVDDRLRIFDAPPMHHSQYMQYLQMAEADAGCAVHIWIPTLHESVATAFADRLRAGYPVYTWADATKGRRRSEEPPPPTGIWVEGLTLVPPTEALILLSWLSRLKKKPPRIYLPLRIIPTNAWWWCAMWKSIRDVVPLWTPTTIKSPPPKSDQDESADHPMVVSTDMVTGYRFLRLQLLHHAAVSTVFRFLIPTDRLRSKGIQQHVAYRGVLMGGSGGLVHCTEIARHRRRRRKTVVTVVALLDILTGAFVSLDVWCVGCDDDDHGPNIQRTFPQATHKVVYVQPGLACATSWVYGPPSATTADDNRTTILDPPPSQSQHPWPELIKYLIMTCHLSPDILLYESSS